MSDSNLELIDAIDDLLPQTQCQQCNYAGCRPYATAIVMEHEQIDRCIPGGITTLGKLAQLLGRDAQPLAMAMAQKTKPPTRAVIREDQCIGCTKCIQVCPVDAIIGASKLMHTVLSQICNGCELCIEPCPVDCIDLIPYETPSEMVQQANAQLWRQRYQQRQQRLEKNQQLNCDQYQNAKLNQQSLQSTVAARQSAILEAVKRVKLKKTMQGKETDHESKQDKTDF